MWAIVLVIVGLAIVFLVFFPALIPKMPKELPVSLPTEIKVSMPEIKFPELPDPTKALEGFVEKIPTVEDVGKTVTETISPIIDVIPTIDEVTEGIKELTPEWVKDPLKPLKDAFKLEVRLKTPEEIEATFTGLGEAIDKNITQPVTKVITYEAPEYIKPLPSIEPEKTTVNVIGDALTGLGEAIDQNITKPLTQILPTKEPEIFKRIVRGH